MNTRSSQGGAAALLAVVGMVLLIGAFFALGSVNFASQRVARSSATTDAMLAAKRALVAYAVADANRPGELPCPDVNDDGKLVLNEDFVGSNCVSLIGRIPWFTLGLPDLRDEAGERLWYALSNDFHANGSVALNSDTAFRPGNVSVAISGQHPAANLVAIVFSPGAGLLRQGGASVQNRGCTVGVDCDATFKCTTAPASNTPKCNPANYLDVLDVAGVPVDNSTGGVNRTFASGPRTEAFNDRLLPIHSDDIMWLVERRAARELAQHLRDHYDAWETSTVIGGANNGFYPYAVPLNDPATAGVGTNATLTGMLPLATTPLTWSNTSLGCTTINGGRTLDCNTLVVCVIVCLTTLSGTVENVATRFVDPPSATNVQVVLGLSLGGAATWTLDKSQRRLEFSYGGFVTAGTIHIRVDAPTPSTWLASSWLTDNDWHQNAYYALSSGFAVNATGTKTCGGAGPACLTVSNAAAPNNDKEALIVMTGRALPGQGVRPLTPVVAITELLDGLNADATPAVFEHNAKTTAFNDYPVAVRP